MIFDVETAIENIWNGQLNLEYDILERYHSDVGPSSRFLEIGCGTLGFLGRRGSRLGNLFEHSVGIDIDERALSLNRQLRFPVCACCYSLPLPSGSVDIVMCRWVFEHLEHPEVALKEICRVLKKGGHLFITTSNLLNYGMLISKFTPTTFHNMVRGKGHENTPTFYRANTERRLKKLAAMHGLDIQHMCTIPYAFMYYDFNKHLFFIMKMLSEMIPGIMSKFHLKIICIMKKTDRL